MHYRCDAVLLPVRLSRSPMCCFASVRPAWSPLRAGRSLLPLLVLAFVAAALPRPVRAAPEAATAYPISEREIQVAWAEAEPAVPVRIERRPAKERTWQVVAGAADGGRYVDRDVAAGEQYYYRVSAAGAAPGARALVARAQADDRARGQRTLRFQPGLNGYAQALGLGIDQRRPGFSDASGLVWVVTSDGGAESQALLRFDEVFGSGSAQVPPGARVSSAHLRIYVSQEPEAWTRNRVFFHRMLVEWGPGAAWNFAGWGGDGAQVDDREAERVPSAHVAFSNPGYFYNLDVTETVRAWAAGAPNHGWLLRNRMSNNFGLTTPQAAAVHERPELVISFDADPANRTPRITQQRAHVADGAVRLEAVVEDDDGDELEVVFHGRRRAQADEDFTVVVLPDTQYYVSEKHGGTPAMFHAQIDWIVRNAQALNIGFVLHLGDIVEHGDRYHAQWKHAAAALHRLDDPAATGRPEGIPYAVCVGNHDQTPIGEPNGTTGFFNRYFGAAYFGRKSSFGGNFGENNDNHFHRFQVGGLKFLVLSLEYGRPRRDAELMQWADGLLKAHPDHRAIVLTHYTMDPGPQGPFSPDGGAVYRSLRENPNLALILGGHITGEGRRTDVHDGRRVHSLVQDFQFDGDGGAGFLGVLTFSPRRNELRVQTYSPWTGEWRRDPASDYVLEFDFGTVIADFAEVGRGRVPAGGSLQREWAEVHADAEYEWFVEAGDGGKLGRSELQILPPPPGS